MAPDTLAEARLHVLKRIESQLGYTPAYVTITAQEGRDVLALVGQVVELREATIAAVSRLTLARASMRAFLKSGDEAQIEAWLLAEKANGWINEVAAVLSAAGTEAEPDGQELLAVMEKELPAEESALIRHAYEAEEGGGQKPAVVEPKQPGRGKA